MHRIISFICLTAACLVMSAALRAQQPAPGQSQAQAQAQAQAPAQQFPIIRQIQVVGNQRVEPETIASYLEVRVGDPFDPVRLDSSLKNLFNTQLFADIEFQESQGALIVRVVENPIINRVVFEGNKRLDNDELLEEVRVRPRNVFTRAKIRADVQRMLNLYRASGRFAAIIEPKVVQLEQNRVDVLFEIQEGPRSKVAKINFIGNRKFSDSELRDVLATKQARWWKFFTSNDTFDPDRLAFDQQVLRQFYLNEGYADFRTVSAVAELAPDREDFFLTFTIEEGEIYQFGEINVKSEIRGVNELLFKAFLRTRAGDNYNAERIEETIEALTNAAGLLGYAFVDIRPRIDRDREARTISIEYVINDAPRVYVERINIRGNVQTLDRVVRREIRLQEGDAFNSALVERSENRLRRLNFFREVEVERQQGSRPDRLVLDVSVEEQATGQLNVSAGFSSLESFLFDFSIAQQNFLGKGQNLRFGLRLSSIRQEADIGFTEPYFLGRTVAAGFDLFARRQRSNNRLFATGFNTDAYGFTLRGGAALNEFWTLSGRYTLQSIDTSFDEDFIQGSITRFIDGVDNADGTIAQPGLNDLTGDDLQAALDEFDTNGNGVIEDIDFDADGNGALDTVEQARAANLTSPFLLESLGRQIQSIIGVTVGTDSRNSFIRPTRGTAFFVSADYSGLGGDITFLRSTVNFDNYWTPFAGWTFRQSVEGGYITGLGNPVRLNDRFFIGNPRIRGFDNVGIGPRQFNNNQPIGGTAFYIGRAELFVPLGDAALESGIAASIFVDAGSSFRGLSDVQDCAFGLSEFNEFQDAVAQADIDGVPAPAFGFDQNCIAGDSISPRVAVGFGVSWQSPFGPFRIDLSRALRQQLGDDTQTLQFNVGTAF